MLPGTKWCDIVVHKGLQDDDLDNDGTDFHQQHRQWLKLLGNNCRINFHGLKDQENLENFYAYGRTELTADEVTRAGDL